MKNVLFLLMLLASLQKTFAQTREGGAIKFSIITGSDDLRGGNNCFMTLNMNDRTSKDEIVIGGGFGQNSNFMKTIELPGDVSLDNIRSITIRHDGSPRPGNPFDTYDNWDLKTIRISLISVEGQELNIYNSVNDPNRRRFVQRFTGNARSITLFRQR